MSNTSRHILDAVLSIVKKGKFLCLQCQQKCGERPNFVGSENGLYEKKHLFYLTWTEILFENFCVSFAKSMRPSSILVCQNVFCKNVFYVFLDGM